MADIVEELRLMQPGAQWACGQTAATLGEAADEIERLRVVAAVARREGIDAAVVKLRDMGARLRRLDPVRLEVLAQASTLELAADAIAGLLPVEGVGE